jgi:pSer/pThr/pTyr-binding forkhead associated (FHA) protein
VILPYLKLVKTYDKFSPEKMNEVLRESLEASKHRPCYLTLLDGSQQIYLFFRDGQIYSAGRIKDGQFSEASIKDFLISASSMRFPEVNCFELNSKILHSALILFQKKPTLKVLTSLVDLDQVLDKVEEEGKSVIVSATQDSFLAVLRYEKGKVTALGHELSLPVPKERDFREDFLVKIYTLSAETPLTICIFEDLLVKYACDAKMIDPSFAGDLVDLYLSKPPMVTLKFKGKEIGHWILDKPVFNIGRTGENDIVIDNLAVSRLHSTIEEDKGSYYVRDCDSLNGTLLNKKKVGRARLKHGDEIIIGKHKLVFEKQSGRETAMEDSIDGFDQTIIMGGDKLSVQEPVMKSPQAHVPCLIEKTEAGENVIELSARHIIFGKNGEADVEIEGFLVAKEHAEIVLEDRGYVLRHLHGLRKIKVSGKSVKERVLKNNDEIRIGNKEFIFQE